MTTIAGKYQIFTANGHLVMSGIQNENGYIDISNLKSGVYIIRQGINTSKFVKQ